MSNTLSIGGVLVDLPLDLEVLPTFQVSDLLKPECIQSDGTFDFNAVGSNRNHKLLGQAAVDGNEARVPYKSITNVTLGSEGIEIMPRAKLLLKGFENDQYQLQLFAGNVRFLDKLGDKTLRDLDFSRYDHQ